MRPNILAITGMFTIGYVFMIDLVDVALPGKLGVLFFVVCSLRAG